MGRKNWKIRKLVHNNITCGFLIGQTKTNKHVKVITLIFILLALLSFFHFSQCYSYMR